MKSYRVIAVGKWPSQNEDVFSRYGEMERGAGEVEALDWGDKQSNWLFLPLKNN